MSEPDYLRFFPYEEPFPNQQGAMDRIANALAREQDVLFEGAPGTGKTLSALAPALQHAREEDRTVVITTNVHQQMRQFVEDARAIAASQPIRAVVFKGKSSMCHIDVDYQECQTLRDTTRSLVEAEGDRAELEARQRELLAEAREGDATAAEARESLVSELEEVGDRVESLREGNHCEYFYDNLTADTDEFFAWLFDDVRRPEEIYGYAEERGLCGYELLKEGMEEVDLVVCNYHHLLDPTIREQFFRWLGREPEEVIAVFDEAHNIESAARDYATRTLTENSLEAALDELDDADDDPRADAARNVLSAFRDALVETYESELGFGERERIGDDWEDVPVANEDRADDLTLAFLDRYEGRGIDAELQLAVQLGKRLDENYADAYRNGETTTRRESETLQAASFVSAWMDERSALGQYPLAGVRRDAGTEEVYGRAELYTCIPQRVTGGLFEEVAASVLMSATLRPFGVTSDVLGLENPVTISFGLAYPERNRRTYAVETPPLFASAREDAETQETIAGVLRNAIRFTPGNTLLFFPSYREATRYHELLGGDTESGSGTGTGPGTGTGTGPGTGTGTGRTTGNDLGRLLLDEAGTPAEQLRQSFVESDDAALFTSLWGTLAEGVSFDDGDARTVVVVGVPYPHLSERMEAVQEAYGRAYEDAAVDDPGWEYAVEIPTVRKTRQALGRVIRSPDDFGVRVLVDKRYTDADMGKYSVRGTFPVEEREELIDLQPGKLKFAMLNFYADHDAYDGEPPQP
ncbi:MAG: ATP-dependent DNA helicase [Haloferacaceae archaeon]